MPLSPKRVKLIAGLISNEERYRELARASLIRNFGPIDFESAPMDFRSTAYYNEEFGENLKRTFISFAKLARPEGIARAKLVTNALEARLSLSGKRRVNIDPGYVDLSKLVLLTTKDYSHRIHLSKGIYGEVTLYYREGTFRAWEWTYPDYRTQGYIDIFNTIRALYRGGIRSDVD